MSSHPSDILISLLFFVIEGIHWSCKIFTIMCYDVDIEELQLQIKDGTFFFWIIFQPDIEFLDCDWNWNVKGWIPLALSSSSTSLGVFSFASFLHSNPQKPSPFCPPLPAEKRICHLCHRIYMTLNKQRSNPFSWQEPSSFALFVFHYSWPHHGHIMACNNTSITIWSSCGKKIYECFFFRFGDEVVIVWVAQIQNFLWAKVLLWLQNHALIAKLCFGCKHHVLWETIVFCGSKQFKALLFSRLILIGII